MSHEFPPLDGLVVPAGCLTLPRAHGLAEVAGGDRLPFVRLVECRRRGGTEGDAASEIVVIDAIVERPQAPAHDIRREERLAVIFDAADCAYPEVLTLRPDFPRVPHLNLTSREFPCSLCLYDRPWHEIALRWTPASFVERIRYWLAQTARGALHQHDQPLEPLLFGSGLRIILPAALFKDLGSESPVRLDLRPATPSEGCRTLIAREPDVAKGEPRALKYVATTFSALPQAHGIIRRSPANMSELHEFLAAGGIDLVGSLRQRFRDWIQPKLLDALLVIVVALPLTRAEAGSPENWDFWAFLTQKTVREIGLEIGLWENDGGRIGLLLVPNDDLRGRGVPIDVVSPYIEFSRAGAAAASGVRPDPCKVVAVGAGALGSQVITTLARSGFGRWTVVDEDDLLPHNLARHALSAFYVGHSKALGMAFYLDQLYREGEGASAIAADVLSPAASGQVLSEAFSSADLILDIAASVPVARHLAIGLDSSARRVSLFLNPQGTDVVVLAEDKDRRLCLDALEVQYYRAAASDPRLNGHLTANPGRLRYGRSCRDITASIPTHLVTMHAAIASEAIRRAREIDDASIRVWRCDVRTIAVTPIEIMPAVSLSRQMSGWKLTFDLRLLQKLTKLRTAKLPNETGGVLIGVYDLNRRLVYVVDTIPSPPDSAEWPTLYIRGSEGLLSRVQELSAGSGGQLEYVGEWHSHPDRCSILPSADDLKVFTWLTEHLSVAGLPALMAIIGECGSSGWYLGEMLSSGGWTVSA